MESSNKSDGGTMNRVVSVILQHMNDNLEQFYILTANDISKLPASVTRSKRIDTKWFFDFPRHNDRKAIFKIHFEKAGHQLNNDLLELCASKSINYTGAEIATAVNNAICNAFLRGAPSVESQDILEGLSKVATIYGSSSSDVNALKAYVANPSNKVLNTADNSKEEKEVVTPNKNLMSILMGNSVKGDLSA